MRNTLIALTVAVLLVGCKNPLEKGPRFGTIGFGCIRYNDAVAIQNAEANNNGMAVQALLKQGCLMVKLGTTVTPTAKAGEYIRFETTPKAMGIHMVPGMEKIDKLTLWTLQTNLKGIDGYQTKKQ